MPDPNRDAVALHPDRGYRGRGFGSALTARAAWDGFAGGARFAFLQSSDMGHAVYGRLGVA